MARSFRNWLVELSNTTGTGAYTLAGAPGGTSYFTFRQKFANGEKPTFFVVNKNRTKMEVNENSTLTYGPPDQLARGVVESTNGDAPIPWTSDDLPLRIYCAPHAAVAEGVVTKWLAAARHALIRFGDWGKQDDAGSGKHSWKFFDGTNDIQLGVFDTAAHSLVLDPTLSAWRQLGEANPSGAPTIDFTGIPSTINHLMVVAELKPGTNGVDMRLQTYGADGVLDTGGSDYAGANWAVSSGGVSGAGGTPAGYIDIGTGIDSTTNGAFECVLTAVNIQRGTNTKFNIQVFYRYSAASVAFAVMGGGWRAEADRITGLRISPSSGTVTGKVTLHGA